MRLRATRPGDKVKAVSFTLEALEERRLLAAAPWGTAARLIGQDVAAQRHAALTGAGQTIAIIDSGVDYMHPALGGGFGRGYKVVGGWDFVDNDADPMDEDGHGTAVAGMAAANAFTYNGYRYRGIAPDAQIAALRVDDGTRWSKMSPRIELALQWVLANRAKYNIVAVNISLGTGHYTTEAPQDPLGDELAALAAAGVFVSSSSGNDGVSVPYGIEYPGSDPNVFSIGSINLRGAISAFTERGPTMDLLAPGEDVTTPYYDPDTHQHVYIDFASGTSFSSPVVAGAAALLKQIAPSLTPAQIMAIFKNSGKPNYDGDDESGAVTRLTFKQLDLAAALDMADGGSSQPISQMMASYNGIAYDASGNLHLAYYDVYEHNVKYAVRNRNGTWSAPIAIADSSPDVGQFLSLAVDSKGLPGISYYDAWNADLKYAHYTGSRWAVTTVDSKGRVGMYSSLGFDGRDNPVISYYYRTDGDLRFATVTIAGWQVSTVDSTDDSGRHSSLALNPVSGRWAVAYEDSSYGLYRYAQQGSSGKWHAATVETTQGGGGYISLAFDPAGQPAFSYYDAYYADLGFAHYDGRRWRIETVASRRSQGLYTRLMFDPDGTAEILYFNKTANSLMLASGDIGSWVFLTLAEAGGRNVAVAAGPFNRQSFTWTDGVTGYLLVEEM